MNADSVKDDNPSLPEYSLLPETAEAINQESELILQVRALIEQHLGDGEYGVEQLAQGDSGEAGNRSFIHLEG